MIRWSKRHDVFSIAIFTPQDKTRDFSHKEKNGENTTQDTTQDNSHLIRDKEKSGKNTTQVDRTNKILEFCTKPKTREENQEFLGMRNREYFRKEILKALLENKLLFLTIPDKPNSPKQNYYSKKQMA